MDGPRGATFGARLQKPAQQDQRDDDRRRLVIDVYRARRQGLRRKGGDQRIAVGGGSADRDQTVHVRDQAPQGGETLCIETATAASQHQSCQHELHPPAGLHSDGAHDQVMHRNEQMRAHFQRKDGQGQHGGQRQIALQSGLLLGLARGGFRIP